MRRTIAKNKISLKFDNARVNQLSFNNSSYQTKRDQLKLEKSQSSARNQSGVKRSLYKRIRMERATNQSFQLPKNIDNLRKGTLIREKQLNVSIDDKRNDKYDIKVLEDKIKQLDQEIYLARANNEPKNNNRSNSISTYGSEFDTENLLIESSDCGRKTFDPYTKSSFGQLRGLISRMADLVNKNPETSKLINLETPSVVKSDRSKVYLNPYVKKVVEQIQSTSEKESLIESENSMLTFSTAQKTN